MTAVAEAVEQCADHFFLAQELEPLIVLEIRDYCRSAPVTLDDDLIEIAGLIVIQAAETKVVDLCGAPHKSINGDTSVM